MERKEIITEIIETEIKYGRDLRIIYEEFYRPMMVAGLLAPEQLANIFLNVEELIQVNAKFTESLKDAIEIALDQGDEDMCTVSIGKLFLEASPMLGAFKSYCTRQVSDSKMCYTVFLTRYYTQRFFIDLTFLSGLGIRTAGKHGEGTGAT